LNYGDLYQIYNTLPFFTKNFKRLQSSIGTVLQKAGISKKQKIMFLIIVHLPISGNKTAEHTSKALFILNHRGRWKNYGKRRSKRPGPARRPERQSV